MDARPATGPLARELIDAARRDVAEADQQSQQREADAEAREAATRARERTTIRVVLGGLVATVVLLGVGLAVAIVLANDAGERAARAEAARADADIRKVAAELAQPVAERVLADGRAESARTYRAGLDRANRRLLAAGLPIVGQPPASASSAEVQRQSIRATVLADLGAADLLARALREQYRGVNTFPALLGLDDPSVPAAPDGDVTVTVLPDDGGFGVRSPQPAEDDPRGRPPSSGGDRVNPPAPPRGTARPPAPQPAPAPAPAPTRPRLRLPLPAPLDLPVPRLPLL